MLLRPQKHKGKQPSDYEQHIKPSRWTIGAVPARDLVELLVTKIRRLFWYTPQSTQWFTSQSTQREIFANVWAPSILIKHVSAQHINQTSASTRAKKSCTKTSAHCAHVAPTLNHHVTFAKKNQPASLSKIVGVLPTHMTETKLWLMWTCDCLQVFAACPASLEPH